MKLKYKFYSVCENGDLETAKKIYPQLKISNSRIYIYFLVACLKKDFEMAEWLYSIRER